MEKAQEEQKGKGVIMTGDRLKEYNGLKQQVAAKTNQAKAQLQALQRQQAADQVSNSALATDPYSSSVGSEPHFC